MVRHTVRPPRDSLQRGGGQAGSRGTDETVRQACRVPQRRQRQRPALLHAALPRAAASSCPPSSGPPAVAPPHRSSVSIMLTAISESRPLRGGCGGRGVAAAGQRRARQHASGRGRAPPAPRPAARQQPAPALPSTTRPPRPTWWARPGRAAGRGGEGEGGCARVSLSASHLAQPAVRQPRCNRWRSTAGPATTRQLSRHSVRPRLRLLDELDAHRHAAALPPADALHAQQLVADQGVLQGAGWWGRRGCADGGWAQVAGRVQE